MPFSGSLRVPLAAASPWVLSVASASAGSTSSTGSGVSSADDLHQASGGGSPYYLAAAFSFASSTSSAAVQGSRGAGSVGILVGFGKS